MIKEEMLCSKTCVKQPLSKRLKLLLNAGQKYCRMLQREHSAILSTFIKFPFVIKIFVKSTFERPLLYIVLITGELEDVRRISTSASTLYHEKQRQQKVSQISSWLISLFLQTSYGLLSEKI